jgi:hypothetical protein
MNINDLNKHERDALIEFEPEAHKYTCAGEGGYTSVTTWLHSLFKAFDADAIIEKMMSNPVRWAKSPYYGKSPAEIKAGWDKGRDEAAALGTEMHKKIERWASPPDPPAWVHTNKDLLEYNATLGTEVPEHFIKFAEDFPDLTPYRTEWMIFDEDIKIAGSIDLVGGYTPQAPPQGIMSPIMSPIMPTPFSPMGGQGGVTPLCLYDWKRCKEIKKTNSFGDSALPECINHLPDTNFWHYALQLNTYKAILERKYDKKIEGMYLVILHPSQKSYLRLTVPDLSAEIDELFKLRL